MQTSRRQRSSRSPSSGAIARLRARLADAEQTFGAIRNGEVDAVIVAGKSGPQVFTLEGAGHAYRILIESMNEGALTLTAQGMVLYANQCFARMVRCPLEQVAGSSFGRFLSVADRAALRQMLKRAAHGGAKIQLQLQAADGSRLPGQISLRSLARKGARRATIAMVVTDMTAARRTEELLRTLSQHIVQAQEAERRNLALELHDRITQLICAAVVGSHRLANQLAAHGGPVEQEAITLRTLLGQAADEVERISRGLRPGVLGELGLAAALRDTVNEFAERTGVSVKLTCVPLRARLPADTELIFFRILQEALLNVGPHARTRHVTVQLRKSRGACQLMIHDDGIGIKPEHLAGARKGNRFLGLLCMRERVEMVGGKFRIVSAPGKGTTILAEIPFASRPEAPPEGAHQRSRNRDRTSTTNDSPGLLPAVKKTKEPKR